MTEFREMGLKPELISSLEKIGFVSATEVQKQAIPEAIKGNNVIARAKTGTGKTAGFIVPIMQLMPHRSRDVVALIIVPTRELALQVSEFSQSLGQHMHIYTTTVYGGASINVQTQALRSGPNIVVGTPGRIIDLIERGALKLSGIKFLVLDEADVMLEMGFIEDVEYIISKTPREKQTMLFSATIPKEIAKLEKYANGHITKITVGNAEELVVNTIRHSYTIVPRNLKFSALLAYVKEYSPKKAIIFARTKFEANTIHRVLESQKYHSILMHGGLTQAARERSLGAFRRGGQFLIATNVAARGLDIAGITDIINFGAPEEVNVYVHRVGRSARMGKDGRAMIIADPEQKSNIRDIEDYANVKLARIELDLKPFERLRLPISQPRRGDDRKRGFRDQAGGGRGKFEGGSRHWDRGSRRGREGRFRRGME